MINAIFHAHSGLRFLVLLAALVALAVQAAGAFGGRPSERVSRISVRAFTGLLDLQILLGIAMVALGCLYGAVMGHLVMMALAAIAAHGCASYARRQPDPRRAHAITLVGIVVALGLIAGGIAAIGRTPITMLPRATCTAAG